VIFVSLPSIFGIKATKIVFLNRLSFSQTRMNKILHPLYTKLRIVLYVGVMLTSLLTSAQQNNVYNQFFMNPYVYNPAYVGVDGHPVLFTTYKQQWAKIPDGPQLIYASYHTPLKGGIGIGGAVIQNTLGPLSTTSFKASGSYLVNIDRKHFLRLGMSLGLGTNKLTPPEDAFDGGDLTFQGESSMYVIGDFGATYHFGHFNAGVAFTNLFQSGIVSEKSLSPFKVNPTDNVLVKINYRGHINHDFAIEPHIIYRYSTIVPSQYEAATIVHVKHLLWLGGAYRQYAGFVGLAGAKFNNKFAIGAAFELGSQDFGALTGSTFEIQLGIHLGAHKDHERSHIAHHSSFLRTESEKHMEEKRLKDEREAQQAIADLQDSRDPGVSRDPGATVPTTNTGTTSDETPKEWSPIPAPITRTNAAGELETGQRLERTNEAGEQEIVMAFTPSRGTGAAWALAPGASQLLERARPDGTKEVGVKWVRINENGTLEQTIKWEKVVGEAGAAAALAGTNPGTTTEPDEVPEDDPIDTTVTPVTTPPVQEISYEELASSDKHLVVTRGGHFLELPAGNHIIGGVFDDFDQAETESDKLFRRGMRDVKVGYVSARGHYYVVVGSYSSVTQAQKAKGRIKSSYSLKDVWVLKVNN